MPEIAELSKNIIIDETREGLNVSLVDQDGRSMFPDGSVQPYDRTRRVLAALAPVMRRMPNRLSVTGHTAAARPGTRPTGSVWDLSAGRAISVREILAANGRDRQGRRRADVSGQPLSRRQPPRHRHPPQGSPADPVRDEALGPSRRRCPCNRARPGLDKRIEIWPDNGAASPSAIAGRTLQTSLQTSTNPSLKAASACLGLTCT